MSVLLSVMAAIEADINNHNDDGEKKPQDQARVSQTKPKRKKGSATKKKSGSVKKTGSSSSIPGPSSALSRSLKGSLRRNRYRAVSREEADNVAASVIQSWWRMIVQRRVFNLIKQSHRFRTRIVQEIVDTERTYLTILQVLVSCFETPLAHSDILTTDERRTIFGGLTVILGFSQQFFKDINSRNVEWALCYTI